MSTDKRVAELRGLVEQDDPSAWITNLWDDYNNQRVNKTHSWLETQKYVFATDTTTTSNSSLPWTHKTTLPKLTQIRDNLHANYLSSLFPNNKWLSWTAYSHEGAVKSKAQTIEAYMENKTREGGYRDVISRLLYDYIDYGNAFVQPTFETRYKQVGDEKTISFVGPRSVRISPFDIVFNPTASTFEESWKIVRSWKTLGEIKKLAESDIHSGFWSDFLKSREAIYRSAQSMNKDDWQKVSQYQVDGFGSLQEYYRSDTVEVLEFYGDIHDSYTGELKTNRMITVADRRTVVRDVDIPSYGGEALIRHVGWRLRPDNLWAMGPLDNLVGLQYMIDHYMNMGANALDLKVMPPIKVIGEVEEFDWGPKAEIHIDEGGDVQEMAQGYGELITVRDWIDIMEARMELYAGAPREAMGIRSPGEKTAFEVQSLENASGRIFQEKIVQFELFMERNLNDMMEVAHRNMDAVDIIRVVDSDIGAQEFREVTKEDITANGIIRPIGARHFAQKATELQNLVGIFSSPIGQMIAPHTSTKALAEFVEDVVDLRGYDMFKTNIAIQEQQELQALATQAEEDNQMLAQTSEEELLLQASEDENEVTEGA